MRFVKIYLRNHLGNAVKHILVSKKGEEKMKSITTFIISIFIGSVTLVACGSPTNAIPTPSSTSLKYEVTREDYQVQ